MRSPAFIFSCKKAEKEKKNRQQNRKLYSSLYKYLGKNIFRFSHSLLLIHSRMSFSERRTMQTSSIRGYFRITFFSAINVFLFFFFFCFWFKIFLSLLYRSLFISRLSCIFGAHHLSDAINETKRPTDERIQYFFFLKHFFFRPLKMCAQTSGALCVENK